MTCHQTSLSSLDNDLDSNIYYLCMEHNDTFIILITTMIQIVYEIILLNKFLLTQSTINHGSWGLFHLKCASFKSLYS